MKFITDVQGNEPVLLTPEVVNEKLLIVSLEPGARILFQYAAPVGGWTHSSLCALDIPLLRLEAANAYLGGCWVGSTEV